MIEQGPRAILAPGDIVSRGPLAVAFEVVGVEQGVLTVRCLDRCVEATDRVVAYLDCLDYYDLRPEVTGC